MSSKRSICKTCENYVVGRNTRVANKRHMTDSSDAVPAKKGNNSVE